MNPPEPLPTQTRQTLRANLASSGAFIALVQAALNEDLQGGDDVTTRAFVEADRVTRAAIVARQAGVVAGLDLLADLDAADTHPGFDQVTPTLTDGAAVAPGDTLATFAGPLADMLTIERTLLNILGWLSGIASRTAAFVDAVDGTGVAICDTRKTTPGLRRFEKYAVACGGGTMHRDGLFDAMLVKDNHLAHVPPEALAATLDQAAADARARGPLRFVEVEVDTLDQLDAVLGCAPGTVDIILLDNMPPATLRDAVARRDARAPSVQLEASGGITLETVRASADSGVDRISIGGLTHSAASLDIGLDIDSTPRAAHP